MLLVIGIVWQLLLPILRVPVYVLPTPSVILAAMWQVPDQVVAHAVATLATILAGFALAIAVALPLAALMSLSSFAQVAIYPLLVLTQSVPKVALAPLLLLLLGTGALPKILVTFLVAFFPLVIAVATGLAATPPELIELGRSLRAGRIKELLRIRGPYAVPFIFGGLKVAMTLSVIGAVVGEFVASDQGLGFLMTSQLAFFNTPLAFGAIIVLSLMGIVLFQAVVLAERIFFPWSRRD